MRAAYISLSAFLVVVFAVIVLVLVLIPHQHRSSLNTLNDGIHLAVKPKCGPLLGQLADVNAGLQLSNYTTIVAFGDSYTDGGKQDGSTLAPAVLIPPNPEAGGRSTNGKIWIENIADDYNAKVMAYAIPGSVTEASLWPSKPPADFIRQVQTFLNQSNNLDPETTLYTAFFGINDFEYAKIDGNHLPEAAQALIDQIKVLASPPTNGRSFLIPNVYGIGVHTPDGDAFAQKIFDGLGELHQAPLFLNIAFVDFSRIWDGVLGSNPGYKAFGYRSTTNCVTGSNTSTGLCNDPEHYFYWLARHPSKETMVIMADYVRDVLYNCTTA